MKKLVKNSLIIITQLLVVFFFFVTCFASDEGKDSLVSVSYNVNLDKIATSVSLLFKDERISLLNDENIDMTLSELPATEINEDSVLEIDAEDEDSAQVISQPLYSIDASKYTSNAKMGFIVTEGNKQYDLTDHEFDVVVAVVAGEFDKNLDDALGVVSVILNRCDSKKWQSWAGSSPYSQVIKPGQFEVYFAGMYLDYMPGGKYYERNKYNIAKQAVLDGLNGIRNNNYLGFRASWVTGYSDKYIVSGGNRYGYN